MYNLISREKQNLIFITERIYLWCMMPKTKIDLLPQEHQLTDRDAKFLCDVETEF
jgi:hypothetical protein